MSKQQVPGLHKRPESDNWFLRIVVPTALRKPFYGGRSKLRISLKTNDSGRAAVEALRLKAEHAATFERQQAQLTPVVQMTLTPALLEAMCATARQRILAGDDLIRFTPKAGRMIIGALRILSPPMTIREATELSNAPLTDLEFSRLVQINASTAEYFGSMLARGELSVARGWAERIAGEFGIAIDWNAQRSALITIARTVLQAWLDVSLRDKGQPVFTPDAQDVGRLREDLDLQPPAQTTKPAAKEKTVRDALTEWSKGQTVENTLRQARRAVQMLEDSGITTILSRLTRQDALRFRTVVEEKMPKAVPKTRSDLYNRIQTLLNHAHTELAWIEIQPWAGTSMPQGKRVNIRSPWTSEELGELFASPVYTAYALPDNVKAGRDAAYWVPLLALHGGFRIAEACQLRVPDLLTRDGVPLLSVNVDSEGNRVKTEAGIRVVPVHRDLVRLGFLDYVAARKEADGDDAPLWPDLKVTPSRKGSEYFSDWFREFREERGVYRRYLDFHSFRTTVSTTLRGIQPALNESVIDAILGHEGEGSVGRTNYTVHGAKVLAGAVGQLEFEAVARLFRVYPERRPNREIKESETFPTP